MMLHSAAAELAMTMSHLTRPWMWRLITVALGVAVFALGLRLGALSGLVLMIVGLVPTVIGVADVSVLTEVRDERAHRREQRLVSVSYERRT